MKTLRNLKLRRPTVRSIKGVRPKAECPQIQNKEDCGKNANCSWSSKTNKCAKKRVSKVKDTARQKQKKLEYIVPSEYFQKWFGGFYPDSNKILLGSTGLINEVSIFDIPSKKIKNLSLNGRNDLQKPFLSPDGNRFLMTFWTTDKNNKQKKNIKIFDAMNGSEIAVITGDYTFIAFSPDSNIIAAFNSTGYVCFISISKGKEIKRIKHENVMKSVMSPDFTSIGSITHDGNVTIYSISSGKKKIIRQPRPTEFFCFSYDSKRIATIDNNEKSDNIIRIFEIATGNEIHQIQHNYEILEFEGSPDRYIITNICFSPNGKCIASYSSDGFARIFDIDNGMEIYKSAYIPDGNSDQHSMNVCFSPNSKSLVVHEFNGGCYLFNLEKTPQSLAQHKFPVELLFTFNMENDMDEPLDLSKISKKSKDELKEMALKNLTTLNNEHYRPDFNLKSCKFIFNKNGMKLITSTNYNPSSKRMREWVRWDLYLFNENGSGIYRDIEINGNEISLSKISFKPFVL
jgi:WD40 repeat protein